MKKYTLRYIVFNFDYFQFGKIKDLNPKTWTNSKYDQFK